MLFYMKMHKTCVIVFTALLHTYCSMSYNRLWHLLNYYALKISSEKSSLIEKWDTIWFLTIRIRMSANCVFKNVFIKCAESNKIGFEKSLNSLSKMTSVLIIMNLSYKTVKWWSALKSDYSYWKVFTTTKFLQILI